MGPRRPGTWRQLAAVGLALAATAAAQPTSLPPTAYDGFRRIQGDRITFCIDAASPVAPLERAVASAIAGALLVEASFFELRSLHSLTGEDFLEDLFVLLSDHCDAQLGMAFAADAVEPWLTVTRPYLAYRHVLVTTDPDADRLDALPRGSAIGAPLFSPADGALLAYLATLPVDRSWRRLPYGDQALMLRRLVDGTLTAALMWEPLWWHLAADLPANADVRVIATAPLPIPPSEAAIGLLAQNVFLRQALDVAIGELSLDGTVEQLIEASGVPAAPGR